MLLLAAGLRGLGRAACFGECGLCVTFVDGEPYDEIREIPLFPGTLVKFKDFCKSMHTKTKKKSIFI